MMRLLWKGGEQTHRGTHYTVDHARLYTLPEQPPQIAVAAAKPLAAALAGRVGDAFVNTTPDAELVEAYRAAGGTGPCYGMVRLCWAEDEQQAQETVHRLWRFTGARRHDRPGAPAPVRLRRRLGERHGRASGRGNAVRAGSGARARAGAVVGGGGFRPPLVPSGRPRPGRLLQVLGGRAPPAPDRLRRAPFDTFETWPADSFSARSTLTVGGREYEIVRLDALQSRFDVARLPYTLRILLENVLRTGTEADVEAVATWVATDEPSREISFAPARVLLQDFTGVPAVVDLAAMRDAMADLGGDAAKINPLIPAELVIDHSVQVDEFATRFAFRRNVELEFERNRERYAFLRWGQTAFGDFKVVPPGTGIVHQVNLEYLARVIESRDGLAFPDTLVGTDSHTTMVNGLGVLGWGVGGIEAEAAMLGEALSMLVPQVVGFKLTGELVEGATATDLVLTVTEILRQTGVVGKFVEYFGHGLAALPLADRATIGNMSPEYGATCGFFPVDEQTIDYLRLTGPARRADRARRGLLQGEPALAPAGGGADVLGDRGARPLDRRAVARGPAPAAGPRAACAREDRVPRLARHLRRRVAHERQPRQGRGRHLPGQRPDDRAGARRKSRSPCPTACRSPSPSPSGRACRWRARSTRSSTGAS